MPRVLVFPIVWSHLRKEQQIALAKPVIHLLAREHHARQAFARPNVMQAMLEAISLSQPQPKVPPELLRYLGKVRVGAFCCSGCGRAPVRSCVCARCKAVVC
jgi:hypothetical protein